MSSTAIVWFRRDLRLTDNPALQAAAAEFDIIVPLYIYAPHEEAEWQPGAASNWWLHHSLKSLAKDLAAIGASLVIRQGDSRRILLDLAASTSATAIYWNRLYEPAIIERDAKLRKALRENDLATHEFNGYLLHEPGAIMNKSGAPYKVFTPFWKSAKNLLEPHAPSPPPELAPFSQPLESLHVDDLGLLPAIKWYDGLAEHWSPGEAAGLARLENFIEETVMNYHEDRNRPDRNGTSRLSPHLHFGEVSPNQIVWAAQQALGASAAAETGTQVFLSEVGWREFAHHLLAHFPHTTEHPLRPEFKTFPWRQADESDSDFNAWCHGKTGVPMVDAGMRELWRTGWMHNRMRMIVASFLTKNQLISWQCGARWFWDTLVDANLASNTLGWQWTAGCGADAAPFFRIFNPVRQGEKFDPNERYVRRWCRELSDVPAGAAHAPWTADNGYAEPIVDLGRSRELALEAYQQTRRR